MNIYKRHRFPPDVISYAVWLYHRFNLSHRDIEDLLAERGVTVSHESIRLWCIKFGPAFARKLRRRHPGFGDTFYIDEVFVRIRGNQRYLWRAVDQDGDVVDVFLQDRRDARTAKRFFRRLIRRHGSEPWKIVTDKLGSCRVAHRELVPRSIHVTDRYANNRSERQGFESGACGVSNPQPKRNAFWMCILRFTTCSTWVVIWSERATTAN